MHQNKHSTWFACLPPRTGSRDRATSSSTAGLKMSARVYVGNLPLDCREREVEDLFYKVWGTVVHAHATPHAVMPQMAMWSCWTPPWGTGVHGPQIHDSTECDTVVPMEGLNRAIPVWGMRSFLTSICSEAPLLLFCCSQYGRIVSIDLKLPPRPPGFAFVQFEDSRDAEEAVRGRDGYDFHGARLRVSSHAKIK